VKSALGVALTALVLASPVSAEPSPEPLALRLAPDPDALERARTAALEQRLVRTLVALPEVERAEVELHLPSAHAALDLPLPAPSATVVLVRRSRGSSRADVRRVLDGVPGLASAALTLIERTSALTAAPSTDDSFVHVGPFRVHPGSATGLRLCVAISLLANALLALLVLARARRHPPAQRKVDRPARTPIPP
jgi:hypothetical protein